jgi:hypothetical protein
VTALETIRRKSLTLKVFKSLRIVRGWEGGHAPALPELPHLLNTPYLPLRRLKALDLLKG